MSTPPAETVIRTAAFNDRVTTYWLMGGVLTLGVTILGIPLIPLWIFFGRAVVRRYLKSMQCVLTTKNLKVSKGVWVRVEKTIPLDKITDLGMIQGPLMRHFDVESLSVETAGQSGPGALVTLTGIVDAKEFREAVLAQRDAASQAPTPQVALEPKGDDELKAVLVEIRDAMLRMEQRMK